MESIYNLSEDDFKLYLNNLGEKPFRAKQIIRNLFFTVHNSCQLIEKNLSVIIFYFGMKLVYRKMLKGDSMN